MSWCPNVTIEPLNKTVIVLILYGAYRTNALTNAGLDKTFLNTL